MPVDFSISDEDIAYAEERLLPEAKHFDQERIDFIKNLSTLDLQAVPGSGKTTALLAKLLILERYLPFQDGSGILVISHTNAAVDEIRDRIGQYCPKLFKYPNFVGTIQSFVDQFLTVPYFSNEFKKNIVCIDNQIYEEFASRYWTTNFTSGFTSQDQKNAKQFLLINDLYKTVRFENTGEELKLVNKGKDINIKKPRSNTDWTIEEKEKITTWIRTFKIQILRRGVLCYDDAYMLALSYFLEFPRYSKILCKRFKFVFVDEMQDIDKIQHDILELIFIGADSDCCYQRIGDRNQAIYSGIVSLHEIWSNRSITLQFTGSHRLSSKIAKIVEPMGLIPVTIHGQGKNADGSEIQIKPHLIKYTAFTIQNVVPKFGEVISQLISEGLIPKSEQNSFKAVGWRKDVEEADRIALTDYCPIYSPEIKTSRKDLLVFESYLYEYDNDVRSLSNISKSIMNGILKILRLEGIEDQRGRAYYKDSLIKELMARGNDVYDTFTMHIYQWSMGIIRKQPHVILEQIKNYIPSLLTLFGKQINKSRDFINNRHHVVQEGEEIPRIIDKRNIVEHCGVRIEIGTVHSVKGQTHTGTLYLETFYDRGKGHYETERLSDQLKGTPLSGRLLNVVQQSARMVYVGLSRPTHLLCLAVHEDRFNENLSDISTEIWEIIDA
jgi:DNA helicase-2/ATP-dependent DNA helicase PcrA